MIDNTDFIREAIIKSFSAAVFAFMYQKPLYSYEVTQTECFS